jgi:hypothetical protein
MGICRKSARHLDGLHGTGDACGLGRKGTATGKLSFISAHGGRPSVHLKVVAETCGLAGRWRCACDFRQVSKPRPDTHAGSARGNASTTCSLEASRVREFLFIYCNAALRVPARLAWLAPLVRVVFGYFWLETGWAKLHNLDGFTARFLDWGVPYPGFNAALSAWTEFSWAVS